VSAGRLHHVHLPEEPGSSAKGQVRDATGDHGATQLKNSFKFGHLLSQIMSMRGRKLTKSILVKQKGPFHVKLAFQEVSCHFSFCLWFKQPGAIFNDNKGTLPEISRFPMLHLLGSHVGKL
jgi:hypothetical protein